MQGSKYAGIALAAAALAAALSPSQALAALRTYVSVSGSDGNNCSITLPCETIGHAVSQTASGGIVSCLDSNDYSGSVTINVTVTIDCSNTTASAGPFVVNNSNATVVIKGVTIYDTLNPAVTVEDAASVILDGVNLSGNPTSISVTAAATNLTVKNSLIQNNPNNAVVIEPGSSGGVTVTFDNVAIIRNSGGILLKPDAGGSINATFDHVTIADNTPGGGLKIDTTNGPVTVDVTDSVISNNLADGINVVGNAGNQAMVSIKNSVIAKNGLEGVVADGANAAVLLQMTLLDQNAGGATSVVSGGHISTYGNNSIVGSAGSGFTASAPLQ